MIWAGQVLKRHSCWDLKADLCYYLHRSSCFGLKSHSEVLTLNFHFFFSCTWRHYWRVQSSVVVNKKSVIIETLRSRFSAFPANRKRQEVTWQYLVVRFAVCGLRFVRFNQALEASDLCCTVFCSRKHHNPTFETKYCFLELFRKLSIWKILHRRAEKRNFSSSVENMSLWLVCYAHLWNFFNPQIKFFPVQWKALPTNSRYRVGTNIDSSFLCQHGIY